MAGIRIERLGHRGDGIGSGPVYAARTLPGEVIDGARVGDRIPSPKILKPSSERVRPPCRHYASCGGCTLQHAADQFVTGWKQEQVVRALAAHGLSAPIRRVHVSQPGSRRRAAFSGVRTKKGAIVGFHGQRSETVVAVPDCVVLRPGLLRVLPTLEALTRLGVGRKGELTLSVTETRGGPDVAATGGKPLDGALRSGLAEIAGAGGLARLTWDDETVVMQAPATVEIDGIQVAPPPGAFLQATREGEAALLASVREAVGSAGRILDLFSGCGTFALPLARAAAVHAVEGDAALVAALDAAWRHTNGLGRVSAAARDLFRRPLLPDELAGFDAVVIDPPRAGAQAQTAALAQSGVPRIAAVSCNPTTFSRDAKLLIDAGYRLLWIDVVDQFRWSSHVELAACFTTGNIASA